VSFPCSVFWGIRQVHLAVWMFEDPLASYPPASSYSLFRVRSAALEGAHTITSCLHTANERLAVPVKPFLIGSEEQWEKR
jgi:hypothetical protein